MSDAPDSSVLFLMQPELFTVQELKDMLLSRQCQLGNQPSMTKEQLVQLYRHFILPLPQRYYRTNRRGKLLTARREKAGLDGRGAKEAVVARITCNEEESKFHPKTRLKPPPDLSNKKKIRTTIGDRLVSSVDLDKNVINDRRKSDTEDGRKDVPPTKVALKRPAEAPSTEPASILGEKKKRTAIKWP